MQFPGDIGVGASRTEIRGDDGAWVGTGTEYFADRGLETMVLTGEGAYAGLTAYLILDWGTARQALQGHHLPGRDAGAAAGSVVGPADRGRAVGRGCSHRPRPARQRPGPLGLRWTVRDEPQTQPSFAPAEQVGSLRHIEASGAPVQP